MRPAGTSPLTPTIASQPGASPWKKMAPVGLMWGNDPGWRADHRIMDQSRGAGLCARAPGRRWPPQRAGGQSRFRLHELPQHCAGAVVRGDAADRRLRAAAVPCGLVPQSARHTAFGRRQPRGQRARPMPPASPSPRPTIRCSCQRPSRAPCRPRPAARRSTLHLERKRPAAGRARRQRGKRSPDPSRHQAIRSHARSARGVTHAPVG